MTGQPRPALVVLSLAVGLALLSGCTSSRPAPVHHDPAVPALKLVAFDDCADLLAGLRQAAKESVGPYGLPSGAVPLAMDNAKAAAGAEGRANAVPDAAQAQSVPDHSVTNTHEAGVDEPDLVKTDGRRILTVSGGVLRVVDAATRRVTGSVDLNPEGGIADNADLLLSGDHALVLTRTITPLPLPVRPNGIMDRIGGPDGFLLLMVDLTGAPRVIGRYTFDGSLVDARQVGSTARVVVRSNPRLPFRVDGNRPDQQRIADNRDVIDSAPVEQWLPSYSVDSGGRRTTGRVDCHAVSRPDSYSGASLLTVLTFDVAAPTLGTGDPTSVVADGDTVYANGPSLYVASDDRWRVSPMVLRGRPPTRIPEQTRVYRFDISGSGRPRYVAGGSVPGWLINQYAMSEWNGRLRVATTLGQPWERTTGSESSVYVLDGSLRQIGHVGGLGKGERIYGVRFIGPTGYVVTFRQTDPLYVVDLRTPTSPKVTGELKINGYSAYLHPAGNGRLIGVGQDADDAGRRTGMQVSLFDVTDPARPARLARYAVPNGYTEAEFDPHAFLYWPATGLLVVPVSGDTGSSGALALHLSGTSINPQGTVAGAEQIRRSLVIGSTLWTVSDTSLAAYDAGSLSKVADVRL
jgi:uncharacterized secreted protein with C-terminal beta-propeller domain